MRRYAARFMRCERGNVIMLVGLIMFLLIMAVGVAVDMARAQILQQRISAALDSAGLAAIQTISTPDTSYGTNTQAWVNEEAQRYFNANFPTGYLGAAPITVSAIPTTDDNTINLTATTTQPTVFMQTVGVPTMTVAAASQVTRSNNGTGMELALVLDNTASMNSPLPAQTETKIQALNAAVSELITILYGASDTVPNLYVGIVPFSQSVNVPSKYQLGNWMDASDPNKNNWGTNGDSWGGCVTSRSASTASPTTSGITLDISDDVPSTAPFDEYFYSPVTPFYSWSDYLGLWNSQSSNGGSPDTSDTPPLASYDNSTPANATGYVNFNPWGPGPNGNSPATQYVDASTYNLDTVTNYAFDGKANNFLGVNQGPNALCSPEILPMTASATTINSYIAHLTSLPAVGETEIPLGLAWGWRLLSPNWLGLWNYPDMINNSLPLPYNTFGMQKVVILMTDGTNYVSPGVYSSYGFLSQGNLGGTTSDPQAAAVDLDNRVLETCQALKNNNVIIYTIGFGLTAPDNPPTLADRQNTTYVDVPLLQQCAGGTSGGITGQFFLAPTNAQLQAAFQTIGNALENIRVSK